MQKHTLANNMYFHAGVHATESRGSGKKMWSEVQINVPPQGPYGAPLKIHRRLQQRRRCCPFVAIERVFFAVSRFLLRDTPSYRPLFYFESEATRRSSPRGYEILWEPKRFTRPGSLPICFSLRIPIAMAAARVLARLQEVITSSHVASDGRFEKRCECNNSTLQNSFLKVRDVDTLRNCAEIYYKK